MKSIDFPHRDCEYCGCEEDATHYDVVVEAWLCDDHAGGSDHANTGYCGQSCKLGYGCDGSC